MGAVLITLLVFATVCVISYIEERDIGLGFLKGLVFMLLTFFVLIFVSLFPNSQERLSETIKISALKGDRSVGGSFFLASGTIKDEQYYYYIKETNRGKVVEKISTDNAYLNEGDYEPHIKVYKDEYTGAIAKWFYGATSWGDTVYEIYIPEGSVTTEFNVDLE